MGRHNFASRTDDGALFAGDHPVVRVWLTADGTNAARAIFYDSTDASGTVMGELDCPATGPTAVLDLGVQANTGCYVNVSSSGACRAGVVYD